MTKHVGLVVYYVWLLLLAVVTVLIADMQTATVNADKNIHDLLVNFGAADPPQNVASYVWSHPWAMILAAALLVVVGLGISSAIKRFWGRFAVQNARTQFKIRAGAFADILRGRIELANDALEPPDDDKLANWHTKAKRQSLFIDDRLEVIDSRQLPADLARKLELSIALVKELNEIARQIGDGEGGATPAKRVGAYRHCALKLYRQLAEIAGINGDWQASTSNLAPPLAEGSTSQRRIGAPETGTVDILVAAELVGVDDRAGDNLALR